MNVAWFPKTEDLQGNPYWESLQNKLIELGVRFEDSHNGSFMTKRWLYKNRSRVDILHFHFIQPQYSLGGNKASLRRVRWFAENLLLARILGYKIIWTVHDLFPTCDLVYWAP